jgi:hypothetical protein
MIIASSSGDMRVLLIRGESRSTHLSRHALAVRAIVDSSDAHAMDWLLLW